MNEMPPPKKKRTWLWIVLGVFVFFAVIAAGGLFFAISFFRSNMSVSDASATSADEQFDAVRQRFAGQAPLIQLVDGKPQLVAERATQTPVSTSLTTMHLMAWDEDEAKLVRFSLPFWLLRLKSGPIRLSAYQQGWDDRGVSFRIEDIEKHGPGLLLDVNEDREGRVLIWAE
jgi:hypothetical protein